MRYAEKYSFWSICDVHIGTTNKMKTRCVPEIAFKTSNDSGGYYFMNTFTGKRMHRYNRKELSILQEIIEQVEKLAGNQGWKIMGYGYPFFEWTPGIEINATMENMKKKISWLVKKFQFNTKTTL